MLFKILPVYLAGMMTNTTSGPHNGAHRRTNESHILCYLQLFFQLIVTNRGLHSVGAWTPPASRKKGTKSTHIFMNVAELREERLSMYLHYTVFLSQFHKQFLAR